MSFELIATLEDEGVLQHNPLMGRHAPFNLESFSSQISEKLNEPVHEVELQPWRMEEGIVATQEIQSSDHCIPVQLDPLKGTAYLTFNNEALQSVVDRYFDANKPLTSSVREAFLLFFGAQVFHALSSCSPFDHFNISQCESHSIEMLHPQQRFTCTSACISFESFKLSFKIYIDSTLYTAWRSWWNQNPHIEVSSNLAKSLPMNLSFSFGKVALTPEELGSLKEGDWVLLDSAGGSHGLDGAQVQVSANGRSIAEGNYSEGKVEITRKHSDCFDKVRT